MAGWGTAAVDAVSTMSSWQVSHNALPLSTSTDAEPSWQLLQPSRNGAWIDPLAIRGMLVDPCGS